jgi:putative flippase GtrA
LGLGTVLDIVQGGTATRTFDLRDILADAVGIAVALVLSYWLLEGWCQRLEHLLFPVET